MPEEDKNMDDQTYEQDMDLLTSQEESDWERFLKVFEKKNRKPTLQPVNLSWRFWLSLTGGLGAISLSAFRTGFQFFDVAKNSGQGDFFVWGETIAAVLAVNITIVALSTMVAYKTHKISDFSMTWGLRTAITISALAGLGQAFKGLNIVALSEISNWLLSFAMGAGVTALEYFGGDMIGVELVRYELDKLENKRMFDEQDQDWFANARKQFPSWVLRKTNKRTHHPVSEHTKQQTTNVRREYREQTTDGAGEQTIRTYLEQTFANEQRVLGVSELARMIAANEHSEFTNEQVEEFVRRTKGYISQVRTRWINQKGDMV